MISFKKVKQMNKKKLLVTASTFPRWEGDTEPSFILDLCQALSEYLDITVLVPAAPGAKAQEVIGSIKIMRYHYFPIHKCETLCYPGAIVPRIKEKKSRALLVPFLFIALFCNLRKLIPQFDLIHANWLIPQGIVQACFDKPYVITGLGGDVTSLNIPIVRNLKLKCLQRAKHITVISESLNEYIQKIYPNNKTSVISMGYDGKVFNTEKRIQNYFGQNEKKVVLFVGRLVEKKGLTYLIEAVKELDDVKLIVVGNGPLEEELRRQALLQGEKIQFVGSKKHEELAPLYASADIFVVPSVTAQNGDKEGLPTTIVEAMASGVPIIATRHSGIPELVRDGVNGYLVDEKDVESLRKAIKNLLDSQDTRELFIKNGLETVKEKEYKKIAERYYKIFEELN